MVLPLNLAMTAAEISSCTSLPERLAWMACQFSPWGEGISNVPKELPPGVMLILNDRFPCQGHSADLTAWQIGDIVNRFECESFLLDFQRPSDPESEAMVRHLIQTLPCPAAVSEAYARDLDCPAFLSPAPLHIPLEEYLKPWNGREIWLETALCQEQVCIRESGTTFMPSFTADGLDGGFFDEALCCRYHTQISDHEINFTLFDTRESLEHKLKKAHSLGVRRAVGLYQELGTFPEG